MSFQNHFNMLSLHEPVTHKAKFWQSYVRALKGTDDMRADENRYRARVPRALSEFPEFFGKSLLDDYAYDPNTRIHTPGYRYMPISRETYGYTPRPIYGVYDRPRYAARPSSVPPESPYLSNPSSGYNTLARYPPSHYKPKPWDRETTPSGDFVGTPILANKGGYTNRPYHDLLNPSPYLPISRVIRDPWWYDAYGLKPATYVPPYPSALRTSYLSPVRPSYLWSRHPLRNL